LARPFVIWVSVVLPLLLALLAGYGLLMDVARLARWHQVAESISLWRGFMAMLIQACFVALYLSVIYAALKRPRWGRVVCAAFAVVVTAWTVWRAFYPGPHPRFEIEPGAQQAGATIGEVAMVGVSLAYAYAMLFGRRVRHYFLPETVAK
jgi:hypothetical protein